MMAGIIIGGSIALALAYTLIWWLRPDLRRRIEAPGHRFAADARQYDRICGAVPGQSAGVRKRSAQQPNSQDRTSGQENTESIQ